jgi:hypothetical protein
MAQNIPWGTMRRKQIFHGRVELLHILLALTIASTLAACAAVQGFQNSPEPSSSAEARRAKYYGETADDAYYAAPAAQREAIRDELVYGKMQVLEDDFLDFEKSLNSAGNYVSVGSDLAVLLLSGVAATTGGTTTKSALAAASAGIVGARAVVNKDLYYQKTLPALISQMQANREKARLVIIQNLKQPDSVYPLNSAEIDLKKLEEAGSLLNAVNDISQQATSQKNETQSLIQMYQTTTFVKTPTTDKLHSWLFPNGQLDKTRFKTLADWLTNNSDPSLHNVPVATFVSSDVEAATLEPARERATKELNIQ